MEIDILDLFSGIGGFTQGFKEAGYKIRNHYFSEIDKYAIANYKYNFKDAEHIGSVVDVRGAEIKRPNIITFGSPCQDFSLAGKGKGLKGGRSSLILEAIRIIRESQPDVFIWENVKGMFSSNEGEDFQAIISAFADIRGYRFEWQLLDTVWLLPQYRKRVYLIGYLGDRGGRGIFPITRTDIGTFKGSGSSPIVRTITAGAKSGGRHSSMTLVRCLTEARTEAAKKIRKISKKAGRDFSPRRGKVLQERKDEMANTVTSSQGPEQLIKYVEGDLKGRIRRLTEVECERLQGFKSDWTKYGDFNGKIKEISRTQRYKMIGNAVSVPIIKMIAEKLKKTW